MEVVWTHNMRQHRYSFSNSFFLFRLRQTHACTHTHTHKLVNSYSIRQQIVRLPVYWEAYKEKQPLCLSSLPWTTKISYTHSKTEHCMVTLRCGSNVSAEKAPTTNPMGAHWIRRCMRLSYERHGIPFPDVEPNSGPHSRRQKPYWTTLESISFYQHTHYIQGIHKRMVRLTHK
jgi:hypothetical protein